MHWRTNSDLNYQYQWEGNYLIWSFKLQWWVNAIKKAEIYSEFRPVLWCATWQFYLICNEYYQNVLFLCLCSFSCKCITPGGWHHIFSFTLLLFVPFNWSSVYSSLLHHNWLQWVGAKLCPLSADSRIAFTCLHFFIDWIIICIFLFLFLCFLSNFISSHH